MTQFAFTAAQSNCTWAELAELWDVGDELDVFEIGWVYDHFYPLRTGPEEPTLEGWSTPRHVAGTHAPIARRRARHRHPVPPSGGAGEDGGDRRHRVRRAARARAGCRMVRAGVRRLRHRTGFGPRALRPIRGGAGDHSLAPDAADDEFEGRYYRLEDAWCEPKAAQQPHPPIVLGGKGERRLLPLVARYADRWNYSGDDVTEFARLRDRLGERCEERGSPSRRRDAVGQRAAFARRPAGASPTRSPPTSTPARSSCASCSPARTTPASSSSWPPCSPNCGSRLLHHHDALPPSTFNRAPVMPAPASEASSSAIPATSSTVFSRLIIDSLA